MRAVAYLHRIDKLLGVPAITRNWNTILAVVRILKAQKNKPLTVADLSVRNPILNGPERRGRSSLDIPGTRKYARNVERTFDKVLPGAELVDASIAPLSTKTGTNRPPCSPCVLRKGL